MPQHTVDSVSIATAENIGNHRIAVFIKHSAIDSSILDKIMEAKAMNDIADVPSDSFSLAAHQQLCMVVVLKHHTLISRSRTSAFSTTSLTPWDKALLFSLI